MDAEEKYRCLIIDDEPIALKVIESYLTRMDQFELIGAYTNALDALQIIHSQKIDLIFLDIQMPGMNGLEFIKSMLQPPQVIFTTAFRNFAADAFDVAAVDYLLKPIPFDRFLKSLNKFIDLYGTNVNESPDISNEFIVIKSDKKNHKIKTSEILFIESLDDYIIINTSQQKLICYKRLTAMEEILKPPRFLRVHRSFIINTDYVKLYTHYQVEIESKKIPIGRKYREEVVRGLG